MLKDKKVHFLTEDNREVLGDVLLTFDDIVNGNSYVIYTDYTKNENDELQIYASTYELVDDKIEFKKVDTDEEWGYIKEIVKLVQQEIKNNNNIE